MQRKKTKYYDSMKDIERINAILNPKHSIKIQVVLKHPDYDSEIALTMLVDDESKMQEVAQARLKDFTCKDPKWKLVSVDNLSRRDDLTDISK